MRQPPEPSNLRIEIANEHSRQVDGELFRQAIEKIIDDSEFDDVSVSLAIVDDPTIAIINKKYLDHDYPTDVLSFPLERDFESKTLAGEVIVSADTALENAAEYDWPFEHELLLYVVHGTLHLVGFDDKTDEKRQEMRAAETKILAEFSIEHRFQP